MLNRMLDLFFRCALPCPSSSYDLPGRVVNNRDPLVCSGQQNDTSSWAIRIAVFGFCTCEKTCSIAITAGEYSAMTSRRPDEISRTRSARANFGVELMTPPSRSFGPRVPTQHSVPVRLRRSIPRTRTGAANADVESIIRQATSFDPKPQATAFQNVAGSPTPSPAASRQTERRQSRRQPVPSAVLRVIFRAVRPNAESGRQSPGSSLLRQVARR